MRDKEFRQYAMPAQPAAQPDFEKKLSSTANNVNKRPVQLPSAKANEGIVQLRSARGLWAVNECWLKEEMGSRENVKHDFT